MMQRWLNLWKEVNITYNINILKKHHMITSWDAEKAFTKPNILYKNVLEITGRQLIYLKIIKAIYCKPIAKMKLNWKKFKYSEIIFLYIVKKCHSNWFDEKLKKSMARQDFESRENTGKKGGFARRSQRCKATNIIFAK